MHGCFQCLPLRNGFETGSICKSSGCCLMNEKGLGSNYLSFPLNRRSLIRLDVTKPTQCEG